MKNYIYITALALCGSGLAQDQNPNLNPPQPAIQPAQPAQPQPDASQSQRPPASSVTGRAAEGVRNMFTNWRIEDLPASVQKTVREHSAGQQIADIDRENRNGQPVWEVE